MQSEVAGRPRGVYTALLLLDVGMLVLVVALWSTETGLPTRTHAAFGAMTAIGVAWLGFFGWALVCRRPLFALDRVVAGSLAMAFTTLFLVWGLVVTAQRGRGMGAVALTGGVFVVAAGIVLLRAVRTRRALLRRRAELAAQLGAEQR